MTDAPKEMPQTVWLDKFDGCQTWAFSRNYFGEGGGPTDEMEVTEYYRADLTPSVKPLEWVECGDGSYHDRNRMFEITYEKPIRIGTTRGFFRVTKAVTGGGSYVGDCGDLEAAKAAAQADYEKRILSALTFTQSDKPLEWQPIETAPKDGTTFYVKDTLGQRNDHFPSLLQCGWSDEEGEGWVAWKDFAWLFISPTHWIPSPDGPSDQPTPSDKDKEIERLREALIEYMDHDKDYSTLNNLGDHTESHRWKRAVAVLEERG